MQTGLTLKSQTKGIPAFLEAFENSELLVQLIKKVQDKYSTTCGILVIKARRQYGRLNNEAIDDKLLGTLMNTKKGHRNE